MLGIVTLTVPFQCIHNELKPHRVDCANSSGKMLYQANRPSRDGQLEHPFGHSNSYNNISTIYAVGKLLDAYSLKCSW